jgi:hypothetical protein
MVHLLSNLFVVWGLPYIITSYSNTEWKIKFKLVIIVILLLICLFKFLFKKSDGKNK